MTIDSPDCLEIEPADAELTDSALDLLAGLLVDFVLSDELSDPQP